MGFWLPFTIGLTAAATAYSGYATARAARASAKASEKRSKEAKAAAAAEIKQMQADAAARQHQFNTQIAASREATAQSAAAAERAAAQAESQMAHPRAASALSNHNQQLQASIARMQGANAPVKKKRRAKSGTPESERTKLSIDSGLGIGGAGDTASTSGGLNFG